LFGRDVEVDEDVADEDEGENREVAPGLDEVEGAVGDHFSDVFFDDPFVV